MTEGEKFQICKALSDCIDLLESAEMRQVKVRGRAKVIAQANKALLNMDKEFLDSGDSFVSRGPSS